MVDQPPTLDSGDFLQALTLERDQSRRQTRLTQAEALDDLHRARDAFLGQADDPEAADRDADRLEHLADRLADWSAVLHQELERLETARDQVFHRGRLLVHAQSALPPGALALSFADTLCEEALSGPAGAVLRTAVILAAQRG